MNNERELLELAAKAAGYDVVWNEHWQCFQHRNPSPDKFGNVRHPWVPLDDDGDALRLGVLLGININIDLTYYDTNGELSPYTEAAVVRDDVEAWPSEFHSNDAMKATRRAIVRAAAEIGRAM